MALPPIVLQDAPPPPVAGGGGRPIIGHRVCFGDGAGADGSVGDCICAVRILSQEHHSEHIRRTDQASS